MVVNGDMTRFKQEIVEVEDGEELEIWDIVMDTVETYAFFVRDSDTASELVGLLNALHEENEQLRKELKEKEEEERLYANEILELREANKEFLQFKELGGDY